MTVLRTTSWEGMDPAEGDVVQATDGTVVGVVTGVAQGPGIGQWRLEVGLARVITWNPEP